MEFWKICHELSNNFINNNAPYFHPYQIWLLRGKHVDVVGSIRQGFLRFCDIKGHLARFYMLIWYEICCRLNVCMFPIKVGSLKESVTGKSVSIICSTSLAASIREVILAFTLYMTARLIGPRLYMYAFLTRHFTRHSCTYNRCWGFPQTSYIALRPRSTFNWGGCI